MNILQQRLRNLKSIQNKMLKENKKCTQDQHIVHKHCFQGDRCLGNFDNLLLKKYKSSNLNRKLNKYLLHLNNNHLDIKYKKLNQYK